MAAPTARRQTSEMGRKHPYLGVCRNLQTLAEASILNVGATIGRPHCGVSADVKTEAQA